MNTVCRITLSETVVTFVQRIISIAEGFYFIPFWMITFSDFDQINLRESINSLNRLLPLVSENVSKAVHELYVRGRADKHAPSYIGSILLMLQADLLQ